MEPNKQLTQYLENLLLETIEDENANPKQDFTSLGLDSMSAFTYTSHLKDIVPEIPLTIFLECKNLQELQKYLTENHPKEVEKFLNTLK